MFIKHLEELRAPWCMLSKYLLLLLISLSSSLLLSFNWINSYFLEAISKSGFSLLNWIWLNVSQWLFLCSPFATSDCQYPIEQTLTHLQDTQGSPADTPTTSPTSRWLLTTWPGPERQTQGSMPKGNEPQELLGVAHCEDPCSKCVSYKNIYASSCSTQTAICIYWFQMPISYSSGFPLCYINKSQPSGPQQATLKSVLPLCKSIKSKYNLAEFCLPENWSEWFSQSCF